MIPLFVFVVIMCILVFVGYANEKTVKLPTEIMLLVVSLFIGLSYITVSYIVNPNHVVKGFPIEYLSDYLVDGVLSFMLFSGSCGITFSMLKSKLKIVSLLALLTTAVSTFLFGAVAYVFVQVLGFTQFSFIECLLLGAIISPTDPIAATSILKKVGLSDDLVVAIEGESLFNDGVGIALFVAISSALTGTSSSINPLSFFAVLGREIIGAIAVALGICCILFYFFKRTNDAFRQICISILALSSSYVICQHFNFSGAISSVVCGISFATITAKEHSKRENAFELYYNFWEVIDSLLNYVLYIILGIFFVNIYLYTENNILIMCVAIFSGIIARFLGVFIVSLGIRELPEKLSHGKFASLLTWAGLKGGLSLALMIEASNLVSLSTFNSMIISVFAIVIFTTVIQGLTVERFYKKYIRRV